jgi:two-component system, cell cycle response regulator
MPHEWDEEESTAVTEVVGDGAKDTPGARQAYLLVMAGSNLGEMIKLDGQPMIIGRSKTAGLRLLDDGVSRSHARIGRSGSDWVVSDLGSRNGCFVNGDRVERRVLEEGDRIQLGRHAILKLILADHLDEAFQQHLYDSSLRDGLTLAFNRRYFIDRLEGELRFARRHGEPLSILLLDLDHFKQVNDKHGHLAGDHVLRCFADVMRKSVRNEDVFARYGGEEFAIISRATPKPKAAILGERLRKATAGMVAELDKTKITVTTSIGIASLPECDMERGVDLIAAADRALYAAKHRGRNCVVMWEESLSEEPTKS